MSGQNPYSFEQAPRAVGQRRRAGKKYRSGARTLGHADENEPVPANIMYDRRVVRGNTYAAQVVAANAQAESERLQAEQSRRAAREMARMEGANVETDMAMDPRGEMAPVEGRKHIDVQTDNYLEELSDRRPEVDEETQTESYIDQPPLPLFIPTKTGVDKETQVEDDLFDFDLEVEPLLEVLVGKTLEQGMQEVLEEEELAAIRQRQEEFEQTRNAELAEVQRLEAEARRRFEEKERRMTQEKERIEREADVGEKVAARAFAKDYLSDLHENVLGTLVKDGQFYDPVAKEVEDIFMPWVNDSVVAELDKVALSQQLAAHVLDAAVKRGQEQTNSAGAWARPLRVRLSTLWPATLSPMWPGT